MHSSDQWLVTTPAFAFVFAFAFAAAAAANCDGSRAVLFLLLPFYFDKTACRGLLLRRTPSSLPHAVFSLSHVRRLLLAVYHVGRLFLFVLEREQSTRCSAFGFGFRTFSPPRESQIDRDRRSLGCWFVALPLHRTQPLTFLSAFSLFSRLQEDVVMTRVITSGVGRTTVLDPPITYTVVDVGGQRNERKKWLHCFDDVKVIVFLISLAGYNQVRTNKTK